MSPTERALAALRTQLQFELEQAGADVARASRECAQAQAQAQAQQQRCEAAAQEWRGAMERARINPALLDMLRGILASEAEASRAAQGRLAAAQQRESMARAVLSNLHQRTRAIERAVLAHGRKLKCRRELLEITRNDDLWLQRMWRVPA